MYYGGTAVNPPPEFVLGEVINRQADRLDMLEERIAALEAIVGPVDGDAQGDDAE